MWDALDYHGLRACGKTEPVPYIEFDYMFSPATPDQIIPIYPGKWYGENGGVLDHGPSGRSRGVPDCIETTLSARTADWQTIATIPVRIERTDKPAALCMSE